MPGKWVDTVFLFLLLIHVNSTYIGTMINNFNIVRVKYFHCHL